MMFANILPGLAAAIPSEAGGAAAPGTAARGDALGEFAQMMTDSVDASDRDAAASGDAAVAVELLQTGLTDGLAGLIAQTAGTMPGDAVGTGGAAGAALAASDILAGAAKQDLPVLPLAPQLLQPMAAALQANQIEASPFDAIYQAAPLAQPMAQGVDLADPSTTAPAGTLMRSSGDAFSGNALSGESLPGAAMVSKNLIQPGAQPVPNVDASAGATLHALDLVPDGSERPSPASAPPPQAPAAPTQTLLPQQTAAPAAPVAMGTKAPAVVMAENHAHDAANPEAGRKESLRMAVAQLGPPATPTTGPLPQNIGVPYLPVPTRPGTVVAQNIVDLALAEKWEGAQPSGPQGQVAQHAPEALTDGPPPQIQAPEMRQGAFPSAFAAAWLARAELDLAAAATLGMDMATGALGIVETPLQSATISAVTAPAGTSAPTAAQISAQLLPMAPAAQSGPVELRLSPAELGELRFEIHHRGESVQIVLSAERADTADLLRRHGDQLLQDFKSAGFAGASLSFGQWGSGAKYSQRAPDQGGTDDFADFAAPAVPAIDLVAARAPGDSSRALNLRV